MNKLYSIFKPKREIGSISHKANFFITLFIAFLGFICVFPFIFVLIISLTDEKTLALNGYSLFPEKWSLEAYKYVLSSSSQLLQSYFITTFITVFGTILTILMTSLYAWALTRLEFKYRGGFAFLAFFTMLFSGGLVPFYIVMTKVLGLKDSILSLILPLALNPFYIMVLRTFFKNSVPQAIIDSARIDGAGEWRIFFTIVLPISIPGIATIGLFSALSYWNDWFNALLFIENPALSPLQHLLMKIQNNMEFMLKNSSLSKFLSPHLIANLPQETTKMAMVIIATGPIVLAYPFFQRYFIKGLTLGGVKE